MEKKCRTNEIIGSPRLIHRIKIKIRERLGETQYMFVPLTLQRLARLSLLDSDKNGRACQAS